LTGIAFVLNETDTVAAVRNANDVAEVAKWIKAYSDFTTALRSFSKGLQEELEKFGAEDNG
jgi:hypothetical protein